MTILWLVLVLLSHLAALIISLLAYWNFKEIPTLTLTDSTHYPIWNYQYPAVTTCNVNYISKEKAYKFANTLKKPEDVTVEELAQNLKLLTQLLFQNNYRDIDRNLTRLQSILNNNKIEAFEALHRISPGCNHYQRCLWKSEQKHCGGLIEEIVTTEGYCCAFNYFGTKNYTFKGLYPSKAATKPRRVSACGYSSGLEVLVRNFGDDFALDISSNGYKLMVHHPYEFMDWSTPFLVLNKATVQFISITPVLTYASENVQSLAISDRNCLLYKDVELNTFEYYTYHNCMTECRMNLTMKLCSCVPFYYKSGNYSIFDNIRVCNLNDVSCLRKIRANIKSSLPGFHLHTIKSLDGEKSPCNCLPTCEFAYYQFEGSYGNILKDYVNSDINLYLGLNITNQSVYRVFFSDLTSTRNRCDIYYNWDVLLALFGGILGLFVGFSFVSGFELFYYFTIRPIIVYALQIRSRNSVKAIGTLTEGK